MPDGMTQNLDDSPPKIRPEMGSTGSMVFPKGFIHSHDEIRYQPDWNVPYDRETGRRKQLGDLGLW